MIVLMYVGRYMTIPKSPTNSMYVGIKAKRGEKGGLYSG